MQFFQRNTGCIKDNSSNAKIRSRSVARIFKPVRSQIYGRPNQLVRADGRIWLHSTSHPACQYLFPIPPTPFPRFPSTSALISTFTSLKQCLFDLLSVSLSEKLQNLQSKPIDKSVYNATLSQMRYSIYSAGLQQVTWWIKKERQPNFSDCRPKSG